MRNISSKLLILCLMSAASVSAQSTSTTTLSQSGAKTASKKYTIGLRSFIESDIKKVGALQKSYSNTTDITVGYKFDNGISSALLVALAKDLVGDREQELQNPLIYLSKSTPSLGRVATSVQMRITVPVTEASVDTQGLITSVTLRGSFSLDVSKYTFSGLSLLYRPLITKNFHEYITASDDKINTSYTLGNTLFLSYELTPKVSSMFRTSYYRSFDYKDNQKDGFAFDLSASYELGKNLGISAGYSIGGSALAVNGRDSNVQLYDEDLASYYLGLGFSY